MRMNGLTLIELLATLAIVAVIAIVGVPAFRDLILNQRMTSQINSYVHAVFMAKQSARARNVYTVICRSSTGRRCESNLDWSDGWLLFANLDQDSPAQVDATEPILATGNAFRNGSVRANRKEFVFRPFEIRSTNGTFVFCDARGAKNAKALIISYTGRPRLAKKRANGKPLRCTS